MYNPYFPTGYQNGYPQYQQTPMQSNDGIKWVQGEAGANAWLIRPGETVVLFDSTRNVFYIKSCDQTGKPRPLETYDFSRHQEIKEATQDLSNYVTKDEMKKYINDLFGEGENK